MQGNEPSGGKRSSRTQLSARAATWSCMNEAQRRCGSCLSKYNSARALALERQSRGLFPVDLGYDGHEKSVLDCVPTNGRLAGTSRCGWRFALLRNCNAPRCARGQVEHKTNTKRPNSMLPPARRPATIADRPPGGRRHGVAGAGWICIMCTSSPTGTPGSAVKAPGRLSIRENGGFGSSGAEPKGPAVRAAKLRSL